MNNMQTTMQKHKNLFINRSFPLEFPLTSIEQRSYYFSYKQQVWVVWEYCDNIHRGLQELYSTVFYLTGW